VKQIAQYQDGRLELQEVPQPTPPPGGVLVRTTHSVISIGTEKMKVEQARMNLVQKARARPDQVRKVLDTARNLGWKAALEKVRNRLETPTPLGYSAAGVVVEVDPLNTRFRVGDRVACGGNECAFHAEVLALPDLLVAPVPAGVDNWQAAYTTLCAIALQAVRQLQPQLGDQVLVMGQGLVGLLVTNLLKTAGARTIAVDLIPSRRQLCHAMGAEKAVILGEQSLADEVRAWTDGYGVDAAVICTATQSNAPIEQAAEAARDRARFIIVGNTHAELDWKLFYEKELEIRYSRSYGPGRYDPSYEWCGIDYPIGYVRWTEQRNFKACLELMAQRQINLEAITTRRAPFNNALAVYQDLAQEGAKDVGVVLEYEEAPVASGLTRTTDHGPRTTDHRLRTTDHGPRTEAVSRLDVIGAGNFARTMLLPHLKGQIAFGAVVNQTGLSANHVKLKFGFEQAATDAGAILGPANDPSAWAGSQTGAPIAVLIATRHQLHASLVVQALARNRHVFVEKPICLSLRELAEIDAAYSRSTGTAMVGFNRRFAPASRELRRILASAPGPKTASFRVMPGKLDSRHWYANYAESGGRVLGEACHFLDYFCFLFDAPPARVLAQTTWPAGGRMPFPDSVTAQIEFGDGSCGQLVYSAEGDSGFPKEALTVYAAGVVAEVINFQELIVHRGRKRKSFSYSSKGHAEEMYAWLQFLRGQAEHPLPYEQSRVSMQLTFAVLESIRRGSSIDL
jgi:predicted dehydrogenase/threonine dehydrogenase-like Zn-dependent dehydrogenase